MTDEELRERLDGIDKKIEILQGAIGVVHKNIIAVHNNLDVLEETIFKKRKSIFGCLMSLCGR
jgi:uncharacterized coiled-coil DUF342 family protein